MSCDCFSLRGQETEREVAFHPEAQDTSSAGWKRLLQLVEEAAADGREAFIPLAEIPGEDRRQIITLPATIAKLTAVKHLVLYGSDLVRLPPEIGAMTSLEKLTPYTSHSLHWFPYEITRCRRLTESTVSTRALYGNDKFRAPFPSLLPPGAGLEPRGGLSFPGVRGADAIRTCSVCDCPVEDASLIQAWLSLRVATDVLPLLVNACSTACIQKLPRARRDTFEGRTRGAGVCSNPLRDTPEPL